MQYYMMLINQCDFVLAIDLGTNTCLDEDHSKIPWSRDWTNLLSLLEKILPDSFSFVKYWSIMSCIVQNIEVADKGRKPQVRTFHRREHWKSLSSSSRKLPTHKTSKLVYNINVQNSTDFDYREFPNYLLKDVKVKVLAKVTEKAMILINCRIGK